MATLLAHSVIPQASSPTPTLPIPPVLAQPTVPIRVTGLACTYLPVTDVMTSALWYQRNFGLLCSPSTPLQPDMNHAILHMAVPGPGLFLIRADEKTPVQRTDGQPWIAFCFVVDDIRATNERLHANGLQTAMTGAFNLKVYDPDGHVIELVQPAA